MADRRGVLPFLCLLSLTWGLTASGPLALAPRTVAAEDGEAASDPTPDLVVAVTGEQIPCRVLAVEGPLVKVRIAAGTYVLERAALSRLVRAGAPDLDPSTLEFVRHVAPYLLGADPALSRAAREGLVALGLPGLPCLEAVQADVTPEAAAALDLVVRQIRAAGAPAPGRNPSPGAASAGGGASGSENRAANRTVPQTLDALVSRAKSLLELSPDQEKPFRDAFEAFLGVLRDGGDARAAEERLRTTLAEVLTPMQGATLRGWLEAFRTRRGGP